MTMPRLSAKTEFLFRCVSFWEKAGAMSVILNVISVLKPTYIMHTHYLSQLKAISNINVRHTLGTAYLICLPGLSKLSIWQARTNLCFDVLA